MSDQEIMLRCIEAVSNGVVRDVRRTLNDAETLFQAVKAKAPAGDAPRKKFGDKAQAPS